MATQPADQVLNARLFHERVVAPDLNVNSGVYAAIDPSLRMRMNTRGEYEYVGLEASVERYAQDLLQVSAFGAAGVTEEHVAEEHFGSGADVRRHPILGVYRGLYAGHAVEGEYRERGSSGGIASWALAEMLHTKRVDGVVHLVPSRSGGALFDYRISRTADDVRAGSKSRYYPGQLSEVLREAAESGGRYALTAIPSFAFELRLLQRALPVFRERIPYIVGLICGHQKTANYAAQLAWRVGIAPGAVDYVDFRKKDSSTPASKYLMEIHGTVDGERVVREARQGELLGTDWGHGLFKPNFSDFTEDAFNETADLVLGDAWLPRYVSDSAGTNVVITRSSEIHEMIGAARADGRLHLEDCAPEDMVQSQSALVKQSVTELPERFRIIAAAGGHTPPVRRPQPAGAVALERRGIQRVRLQLSRASHTAWQSAVAADDLSVFERELGPSLRQYRRWQRFAKLRAAPRRLVSRFVRLRNRGH